MAANLFVVVVMLQIFHFSGTYIYIFWSAVETRVSSPSPFTRNALGREVFQQLTGFSELCSLNLIVFNVVYRVKNYFSLLTGDGLGFEGRKKTAPTICNYFAVAIAKKETD